MNRSIFDSLYFGFFLAAWIAFCTQGATAQVAEQSSGNSVIHCQKGDDRLQFRLGEIVVGEFVFQDSQILRPYWCNLRSASGIQLTRNHPPIDGQDPADHATMHPGLWLAFGDIVGSDFWRNKATMKHVQFVDDVKVEKSSVRWSHRCELLSGVAADSTLLGTVEHRHSCQLLNEGILITWNTTFKPGRLPLVFGDQEEMGFGVRVATGLSEKKGGEIISSDGLRTAKATWGKPAIWCDYSGRIENRHVGVTVMPSPRNFRGSWWHNRDYGLMLANPFGRSAMKQGEISQVSVAPGEQLELRFAVVLHDQVDYSPAKAYQHFLAIDEP